MSGFDRWDEVADESAVDPDAAVRSSTAFARDALERDGVTEVCVNRPGEMWVECGGSWTCEPGPDIDTLDRAAVAIARRSHRDEQFGDGLSPLLGGTLDGGERVQIVMPPACERGTIAMSIRRPSRRHIAWSEYAERIDEVFGLSPDGGADPVAARIDAGDVIGAIEEAMRRRKSILVAGSTNAGKTTFLAALAAEAPGDERMLTIEDDREVRLPSHPNRVHLLHSGVDGRHTAAEMVRVSLRLRPSRIMLAEVRGPEAFDLLDVAAAGHGGTLTTCHAGSATLALDRIATMAMQDARGRAMGVDAVRQLVTDAIDMVIHIERRGVWPRVTGLLYRRSDRAGEAATMHYPPR